MAAPSPTVQEQLKLVISMMKEHGEILNKTRKLLADNQAKVTVLENKVSGLESTVQRLESDVLSLKEAANVREQQLKLCSVRIHGLPVTDEELAVMDVGKTLANKVYNRILKPILNAAKAKGDISSVPYCGNAIEECYRAGRPSKTGKPVPIVVKIANKHLRLAIFKNKRTNTPQPLDNEKSEHVKRFSVVEDLTGPSFRLLKQLQDNASVSRAWTVEGNIRFTLKDHPDRIVKVKSIYTPIEALLAL
jgi:hypothetical protein